MSHEDHKQEIEERFSALKQEAAAAELKLKAEMKALTDKCIAEAKVKADCVGELQAIENNQGRVVDISKFQGERVQRSQGCL